MNQPSFMHALTLYEPCISPAFSVDSKIKTAKPFLKVENIQSTCNYLLAVTTSILLSCISVSWTCATV